MSYLIGYIVGLITAWLVRKFPALARLLQRTNDGIYEGINRINAN